MGVGPHPIFRFIVLHLFCQLEYTNFGMHSIANSCCAKLRLQPTVMPFKLYTLCLDHTKLPTWCTEYYLFVKYYSPLHVSSIKYSSSEGHSCTQAAYGTVTLYKSPSVLLICDAKQVYHYKNIKLKLYKNNAAIWFNKTCKAKHLTPPYASISCTSTRH